MLRKRWRREGTGKKSEFWLQGMPVEEAKIDRDLKRKATSYILTDMPSPNVGMKTLDVVLTCLIIFIATPSDLSCFTPKPSTPAAIQEILEWQCQQTMSAESGPLASAIELMQSSGQLRSEYSGINTSRTSSTWLPAYYLPLGGLDDVIYVGSAEIQNALQRIIYRLCSLALTCRSDIIAGLSRPS